MPGGSSIHTIGNSNWFRWSTVVYPLLINYGIKPTWASKVALGKTEVAWGICIKGSFFLYKNNFIYLLIFIFIKDEDNKKILFI